MYQNSEQWEIQYSNNTVCLCVLYEFQNKISIMSLFTQFYFHACWLLRNFRDQCKEFWESKGAVL
jgi:hypothetical protein